MQSKAREGGPPRRPKPPWNSSLPNSGIIYGYNKNSDKNRVVAAHVLSDTIRAVNDDCGTAEEVIDCVDLLQHAKPEIQPSGKLLSAAIKNCGDDDDKDRAMAVAADLFQEAECVNAFSDPGVHNAYITLSGKLGRPEVARAIWQHLLDPEAGHGLKPNEISFRTMFLTLNEAEDWRGMIEVWNRMTDPGSRHGVLPDKSAYVLALRAASRLGDMSAAMGITNHLLDRGLPNGVRLEKNICIEALSAIRQGGGGQDGFVKTAQRFYGEMRKSARADPKSYRLDLGTYSDLFAMCQKAGDSRPNEGLLMDAVEAGLLDRHFGQTFKGKQRPYGPEFNLYVNHKFREPDAETKYRPVMKAITQRMVIIGKISENNIATYKITPESLKEMVKEVCREQKGWDLVDAKDADGNVIPGRLRPAKQGQAENDLAPLADNRRRKEPEPEAPRIAPVQNRPRRVEERRPAALPLRQNADAEDRTSRPEQKRQRQQLEIETRRSAPVRDLRRPDEDLRPEAPPYREKDAEFLRRGDDRWPPRPLEDRRYDRGDRYDRYDRGDRWEPGPVDDRRWTPTIPAPPYGAPGHSFAPPAHYPVDPRQGPYAPMPPRWALPPDAFAYRPPPPDPAVEIARDFDRHIHTMGQLRREDRQSGRGDFRGNQSSRYQDEMKAAIRKLDDLWHHDSRKVTYRQCWQVMDACKWGGSAGLEAQSVFSRYKHLAVNSKFHELFISTSDRSGLTEQAEAAWRHLDGARQTNSALFPDTMTYHAYLLALLNHYEHSVVSYQSPDAERLAEAVRVWRDMTTEGPKHNVFPNTAVYKRMLEIASVADRADIAGEVWRHITLREQALEAQGTKRDPTLEPLKDAGIYKTLAPLLEKARLPEPAIKVRQAMRANMAFEPRLLTACTALLRTFARSGHLGQAKAIKEYVGEDGDKRFQENWLWALEKTVVYGDYERGPGDPENPPSKEQLTKIVRNEWEDIREAAAGRRGTAPSDNVYGHLLKMFQALGLPNEAAEVLDHWRRHLPAQTPSTKAEGLSLLNMLAHQDETDPDVLANQALKLFDDLLSQDVRPDTTVCNRVLITLARAGRVEEAMTRFESFLNGAGLYGAHANDVSFAILLGGCGDDKAGQALMTRLLRMGSDVRNQVFDEDLGYDAEESQLNLHRGAVMAGELPESRHPGMGVTPAVARAIFHELCARGTLSDENIADVRIVTGVGKGVLSREIRRLASDHGWELAEELDGEGRPNKGCLVLRGGNIPSWQPPVSHLEGDSNASARLAESDVDPAIGRADSDLHSSVGYPESLDVEPEETVDPVRKSADLLTSALKDEDWTSRQVVGNAEGGEWLSEVARSMPHYEMDRIDLVVSNGARTRHGALEAIGDMKRPQGYRVIEYDEDFRIATPPVVVSKKELKTLTLGRCFPGLSASKNVKDRDPGDVKFAVAMSPGIGLEAPGRLRYLDTAVVNFGTRHHDAFRQALAACLQNNVPAAFIALCEEMRQKTSSSSSAGVLTGLPEVKEQPLLRSLLRTDETAQPGMLMAFARQLKASASSQDAIRKFMREQDLVGSHLSRLSSKGGVPEAERGRFKRVLDEIADAYGELGLRLGDAIEAPRLRAIYDSAVDRDDDAGADLVSAFRSKVVDQMERRASGTVDYRRGR
jgi:hypothetical protein